MFPAAHTHRQDKGDLGRAPQHGQILLYRRVELEAGIDRAILKRVDRIAARLDQFAKVDFFGLKQVRLLDIIDQRVQSQSIRVEEFLLRLMPRLRVFKRLNIVLVTIVVDGQEELHGAFNQATQVCPAEDEVPFLKVFRRIAVPMTQ